MEPKELALPSRTIFDYLSTLFLDPKAAERIAGRPLPLLAYEEVEERAIDRLWLSYRRAHGAYRPQGW